MSNSPCHECLCLPICRHKTHSQLVQDCVTVFTYLFHNKHKIGSIQRAQNYNVKIDKVKVDLEPTKWENN